MKKNRGEKKRALHALSLGLALGSCLTASMAGNAFSRGSTVPYREFSPGEKMGVYYFLSPGLIGFTETPWGIEDLNIGPDVRRVTVAKGYVVVYGRGENRSRRAALIRENMAVISKHLPTPLPALPKGAVTVDSGGASNMGGLLAMTNPSCPLEFINWPRSRLIVPAVGRRLTQQQSCLGLGIAAALAGYRIAPAGHRLEFQLQYDVGRDSAAEAGGRAVPTEPGNQPSRIPWRDFYMSLGVNAGMYYLVSPQIMGSITSDPFDQSETYVGNTEIQRELGQGYVVVYGENEKIDKRMELAKENMAIIRKNLTASVADAKTPRATPDIVDLPLKKFFQLVHSRCEMSFSNWPSDRLAISAIGENLSLRHFCVGSGITAGLAGYEILPGKYGLRFRRVIDVQAGALVQ